MTGQGVLAVLRALADAGVSAVVDGGWGVDALVGRQTRRHGDVDLVIALDDLPVAEAALAVDHFGRVRSVPELPTRAVVEALDGLRVDFHLVRYDAAGNGWQEIPGEDGARGWFLYPANELRAAGTIDGESVPCVTPWLQLNHHVGFVWKPIDEHDMTLLAREFGIPLPPRPEG